MEIRVQLITGRFEVLEVEAAKCTIENLKEKLKPGFA